jgi:hypothetical protein
MLKVFTYYDDSAKNFFAKSIRSIASALGGENLELVIMTRGRMPHRELELVDKFFAIASLVEVNVHLSPTGTSVVEENPYFVEFLLTYHEHDRLYVDPRMFLISTFVLPENAGLFFRQHQGNLSTKLCYVKAGDQFNLAFSSVRRSSVSSITEIEFSYVVKNNFLIPKIVSSKQIVSGKLLNDSNLSALQTDSVIAIDTTNMEEHASKRAHTMINDYSRKQTLITLSSLKKKKYPKFSEFSSQTTTTTTTEDPIKKTFSIVVTAYKTADYIEECLDSIESQSYFKGYDDFEVLVGVDGCQETLDKLLEIRKKYRNLSVYMMLENSGTYITTNTLISQATKDYIIRFDSDDVMREFLVKQVADNLHSDVLRLSYNNFRTGGAVEAKVNVAHGIMCIKRKVIDEIAGGYQAWKCGADTEFIQRVSGLVSVSVLKDSVFYRRLHQQSLTLNPSTCFESDLRKSYKKMIKPHYRPEEVFIPRITGKYEKIDE